MSFRLFLFTRLCFNSLCYGIRAITAFSLWRLWSMYITVVLAIKSLLSLLYLVGEPPLPPLLCFPNACLYLSTSPYYLLIPLQCPHQSLITCNEKNKFSLFGFFSLLTCHFCVVRLLFQIWSDGWSQAPHRYCSWPWNLCAFRFGVYVMRSPCVRLKNILKIEGGVCVHASWMHFVLIRKGRQWNVSYFSYLPILHI